MDGPVTATQSVLGALVITLLLAALHMAAPRIRRLPLVPEAVMGSFAGGLAVAYVFLHLLPELAEGNEAIGEALSDVVEPTPGPKTPRLTRGTMQATTSTTGYVFLPLDRGPATLILTTSGGRQISALPIAG